MTRSAKTLECTAFHPLRRRRTTTAAAMACWACVCLALLRSEEAAAAATTERPGGANGIVDDGNISQHRRIVPTSPSPAAADFFVAVENLVPTVGPANAAAVSSTAPSLTSAGALTTSSPSAAAFVAVANLIPSTSPTAANTTTTKPSPRTPESKTEGLSTPAPTLTTGGPTEIHASMSGPATTLMMTPTQMMGGPTKIPTATLGQIMSPTPIMGRPTGTPSLTSGPTLTPMLTPAPTDGPMEIRTSTSGLSTTPTQMTGGSTKIPTSTSGLAMTPIPTTGGPTRVPTFMSSPTLTSLKSALSTPLTRGPIYRPSAIPTAPPTSGQSSPPSALPSSTPTGISTSDMSSRPSGLPTSVPTLDPSLTPTERPTSAPTSKPSSNPSSAPTLPPTPIPSLNPSSAPTSSPSAYPSSSPMSSPSSDPSSYPTPRPTSAPTPIPTPRPTPVPTSNPTSSPSYRPSSDPTSSPSYHPSFDPTSSPSSNPTAKPSLNPSSDPTSFPTASPSVVPTLECHDLASYRNPLNGVGCSFHSGTDCTAWESIGLTPLQVVVLLESCPVSCGTDCSPYSLNPSLMPIIHPSSSPSHPLRLVSADVEFYVHSVSGPMDDKETIRSFERSVFRYLDRYVYENDDSGTTKLKRVELVDQEIIDVLAMQPPDDGDGDGRGRRRDSSIRADHSNWSRLLQDASDFGEGDSRGGGDLTLRVIIAVKAESRDLDSPALAALLSEGIGYPDGAYIDALLPPTELFFWGSTASALPIPPPEPVVVPPEDPSGEAGAPTAAIVLSSLGAVAVLGLGTTYALRSRRTRARRGSRGAEDNPTGAFLTFSPKSFGVFSDDGMGGGMYHGDHPRTGDAEGRHMMEGSGGAEGKEGGLGPNSIHVGAARAGGDSEGTRRGGGAISSHGAFATISNLLGSRSCSRSEGSTSSGSSTHNLSRGGGGRRGHNNHGTAELPRPMLFDQPLPMSPDSSSAGGVALHIIPPMIVIDIDKEDVDELGVGVSTLVSGSGEDEVTGVGDKSNNSIAVHVHAHAHAHHHHQSAIPSAATATMKKKSIRGERKSVQKEVASQISAALQSSPPKRQIPSLYGEIMLRTAHSDGDVDRPKSMDSPLSRPMSPAISAQSLKALIEDGDSVVTPVTSLIGEGGPLRPPLRRALSSGALSPSGSDRPSLLDPSDALDMFLQTKWSNLGIGTSKSEYTEEKDARKDQIPQVIIKDSSWSYDDENDSHRNSYASSSQCSLVTGCSSSESQVSGERGGDKLGEMPVAKEKEDLQHPIRGQSASPSHWAKQRLFTTWRKSKQRKEEESGGNSSGPARESPFATSLHGPITIASTATRASPLRGATDGSNSGTPDRWEDATAMSSSPSGAGLFSGFRWPRGGSPMTPEDGTTKQKKGMGSPMDSCEHRRAGSNSSPLVGGSRGGDGAKTGSFQYTFFAPSSGKLGIVIQKTYIHTVKDYSPLFGKLEPGDRIISIDDERTDDMDTGQVTQLLARKRSGKDRKSGTIRITVLSNSKKLRLKVDTGEGGNISDELEAWALNVRGRHSDQLLMVELRSQSAVYDENGEEGDNDLPPQENEDRDPGLKLNGVRRWLNQPGKKGAWSESDPGESEGELSDTDNFHLLGAIGSSDCEEDFHITKGGDASGDDIDFMR